MPSGGGVLRELSRQRVVAAVRELGMASRTDLRQATGLSRGTVAAIVAELLSNGVLQPGPDDRTGSPGRPAGRLRLARGRANRLTS
jgi:hypothetical protein